GRLCGPRPASDETPWGSSGTPGCSRTWSARHAAETSRLPGPRPGLRGWVRNRLGGTRGRGEAGRPVVHLLVERGPKVAERGVAQAVHMEQEIVQIDPFRST